MNRNFLTSTSWRYEDSRRRSIDKSAHALKPRHRRPVFASCASAQDLRILDMEKEKLDGSSPRGVIDAFLRNLESEDNSPENTSTEPETLCSNTKTHGTWTKFFKLWKPKSIKRFASFPPHTVPKTSKKKTKPPKEDIPSELSNLYNKSSLILYTLPDLQAATNNFSKENLIGRGGYAKVYKGRMPDGQLVAVKQLTKGTADEKIASFLCEVGIVAHVNHPNIAKLLGCGVEGGMHLVFQLSSLGSLGSILHDSNAKLSWSQRYKVVLGTANGLLHLHENGQRRIIHRDIKADNILLTEDFEPQICDFGLAKWLPEHWTHHNVSKFEGTFGYFAPEYLMHGIVDEKTDVYAFGVLLLELISGRKALDHLKRSLVLWARPLLDENDVKELVDPSLGNDFDNEEIDRVIMTASLCIEQSPVLRPQMNQVVVLLRGDKFIPEYSETRRRTLQRTYSEEIFDAQEYNSTKYLTDLKRHRELALGS